MGCPEVHTTGTGGKIWGIMGHHRAPWQPVGQKSHSVPDPAEPACCCCCLAGRSAQGSFFCPRGRSTRGPRHAEPYPRVGGGEVNSIRQVNLSKVHSTYSNFGQWLVAINLPKNDQTTYVVVALSKLFSENNSNCISGLAVASKWALPSSQHHSIHDE